MPEDSKKAQGLLQDLEAIEDSAIDRTEKSIMRGLQRLALNVITESEGFDTDDQGRLTQSPANMAKTTDMIGQFDPALQQLGSLARTEAASSLVEMSDILDDIMTEVAPGVRIPVDPDVLGTMTNFNFSRFNNGASATSQVLSDMLFQSMSTRLNRAEFIEKIQATVVGEVDKRGNPLGRHAKTWATTALTQFEGDYVQSVTDVSLIGGWYYSGTLISTSRDFCASRVGRYFTDEEIREDIANNPLGNSSMSLPGGWNCRHRLLPVGPERFNRKTNRGKGGTIDPEDSNRPDPPKEEE